MSSESDVQDQLLNLNNRVYRLEVMHEGEAEPLNLLLQEQRAFLNQIHADNKLIKADQQRIREEQRLLREGQERLVEGQSALETHFTYLAQGHERLWSEQKAMMAIIQDHGVQITRIESDVGVLKSDVADLKQDNAEIKVLLNRLIDAKS